MKSRKIALTLGALASISAGVASAQGVLSYSKDGANVQLYGDIDYYLSYMTSSSGCKLIALQDGAYLRTRLGLKGDKERRPTRRVFSIASSGRGSRLRRVNSGSAGKTRRSSTAADTTTSPDGPWAR